jgi:hypothetical protein
LTAFGGLPRHFSGASFATDGACGVAPQRSTFREEGRHVLADANPSGVALRP